MFDNFKPHLRLHSLPHSHAERQVELMETSILFLGAHHPSCFQTWEGSSIAGMPPASGQEPTATSARTLLRRPKP